MIALYFTIKRTERKAMTETDTPTLGSNYWCATGHFLFLKTLCLGDDCATLKCSTFPQGYFILTFQYRVLWTKSSLWWIIYYIPTWVAWMMVKSLILLNPAPIFDRKPLKEIESQITLHLLVAVLAKAKVSFQNVFFPTPKSMWRMVSVRDCGIIWADKLWSLWQW